MRASTRQRGAARRTARMVAAQWAAPPSARSSRFTEVITDVVEGEVGDRAPDPFRLLPVLPGRPAVGDGAVAAVPRAHVTQDHEGRGGLFPALADVRTAGLLAHRVEIPLPHQPLEADVVRPAGGPHLQPRWLLPSGSAPGWITGSDTVIGIEFARSARPHYATTVWTGWCRRGDSNPHGLPHTPLKRARLPVPPLRLIRIGSREERSISLNPRARQIAPPPGAAAGRARRAPLRPGGCRRAR